VTTTRDLFIKWGTFSRTLDLWTFENVHSTLIPGTPFACRASTAEGADAHVTEGIRRGIAIDTREPENKS